MRGPGSDDTPDDPGDDRDRRKGPSSSDDETRRDRSDGEQERDDTTRGDGRVRPPTRPRADDRDRPSDNAVTIEDDGLLKWFLKTDEGAIVAIRDVITTVAIVALVGAILFGISGVWPPLVAVESGSMEPNMERGDLIFVVDDDRFAGDDPVDETGIVTYDTGTENGHEKFGKPGDVIIFNPDGEVFRTPVIHRAHFWVEEGENWVETRANPDYVNGQTCTEVAACPAEHDGFVTKGDNNDGYDQAGHGARLDNVVKPEWTTGKASFRIPWLGHVRLTFDEIFASTAPTVSGPTPTPPDSTLPDAPTVPQIGLAAVGSAVAVAGSRHSRGR